MSPQATALMTIEGNSKKNHNAPVARLEDNKLATDFGLSILHKRIDEISRIIQLFNDGKIPATACWEQVNEVIARG